jgi:hypothetical protein
VLAQKGTDGSGSGTVTSVAATVPAFLSVAGSPITSSGTLAISLSGTALPVANGGTGATTLTGYVKGTGTSALTASSTIPNTDISGLGTMSTQNANAVAITGGTVNGTTIGATTATTGAFTTVTASTSLTTPIVQATNSAGLALRNSAGTTQISMGAGGGDNVAINVSTNINGTNAQVDISPTGTGHVHIKPTGANSIEIAPTFAGDIDNMIIGAITPKNGSFVDLSVTGTTSFDGSQGTAGQVLTSAGTGNTPTWGVVAPNGGGTGVANNSASTLTISGAFGTTLTVSGTTAVTLPTSGTLATLAGSETFTNKTLTSPAITNALVTGIRETATVSATAATGTINFDTLTQVVLYYTTNASGNFTVNFRGNSGTTLDSVMSTGQSLSTTFLVTNGSTAYYNSAVQVDGSSVTPQWQGGTAPTAGNASSTDVYSYTALKTAASTYVVLASITQFK